MVKMSEDNFGWGIFVGAALIGIPLAIGIKCFSDKSYDEGLNGAELDYEGIFFGRTCEGIWVLRSSFDRGREIQQSYQQMEWRIYQLEQAYSELKAGYKAGYMILQSRIDKLETEIGELRVLVSKIPVLKKRLDDIYLRLHSMKNKHVSYSI